VKQVDFEREQRQNEGVVDMVNRHTRRWSHTWASSRWDVVRNRKTGLWQTEWIKELLYWAVSSFYKHISR